MAISLLAAHVTILGHGLRHHLGGSVLAHVRARGELALELALDPHVGALEPVLEGDAWAPAEHLLDEGVVRVAAAHALGPRDVLDGELLALEGERHRRHVVHGDHLVRADVERLGVVRHHQADDALHGVVHVAEGAGLLAVAPHLELRGGREGLAAEGSGRLLPAALPRALRPVDVVKAADAALHAKVLRVVHEQLLGDQLLEAVGVLGLRGPRVVLLEGHDVLLELLELGVDARARGKPEALHP
mmetsp:Transcript_17233/g.50061  ORF Transcript_17233/g.50061 Transcript_17233/m.50061 type:complete len:245 (+) Transcript_17233:449-1183(+)